ncbi:dihydrodipicolinate synthase family protein [Cohnella terricola]|uniref:Dihydrodipicolinate synthase family protein n=1 Tax=Cohnella terricola TaxID=1289167 RepID=A0A559JTV3_9BACL|nr:dihydrodipicolinate synthase family protein [Cohnella terricola]TVY03316.1 dihydrodipicolinate synthase family protein [Cohnella terricola]
MKGQLSGIVVPIFTQFDVQGGIDLEAMEAHMEALIGAGVDAIFVGGSAGEFIALDVEERERITERLMKATAGRVPFLVHITASNLRDSLRLADHGRALGVDALVAVSPWFWKHDDESLASFFGAIAQRAEDTPVYLYNMPHTGNDLNPALVQRLVREHDNIVGLKNSQDDMMRTLTYSAMPDTTFFTGSDTTALYALSHGADGIISGLINLLPGTFVALKRAVSSGDISTALRCQIELHKYAQLFAGDIRKMKAGAEIAGYGSRRCREPLGTLSDADYEKLRTLLEKELQL